MTTKRSNALPGTSLVGLSVLAVAAAAATSAALVAVFCAEISLASAKAVTPSVERSTMIKMEHRLLCSELQDDTELAEACQCVEYVPLIYMYAHHNHLENMG